MNPLLLYRTLERLRWEQLIYRPLRIAQFRLYRHLPILTRMWRDRGASSPDSEAVAALRSLLENQFVHLHIESDDDDLCAIEEGRFTFLNRTLRIDRIDWNRRYESHLWNYHLHYFDWVLGPARRFARAGDDRGMRLCRNLIESWIREARIGVSDGWDAYPVSLRTVNWIYVYALISDKWPDRDFPRAMLDSLRRQLDFLSSHLELHLLANHLLKNVKALLIGGIFFGEAGWTEKGERLLWREWDEQILDDGGHYERSPMYHAQALADFLECHALLEATGRIRDGSIYGERMRRMAGFLEAMTWPDGSLALFNDAANTKETRPLIEATARICGYRGGEHPLTFPKTGYHSWSSEDGREKMIVDAGEPAVGYNAAHAHCDLLSYQLWLDGQPLAVDSGVHGYGGDRFREYCRSTRAHNTVVFDGIEQSEIWGTFRMGRMAEVIGAGVQDLDGMWIFTGAYRRYTGDLIHERRIERDANGGWKVIDAAREGAVRAASSFIHLHPDVEVESVAAERRRVIIRRYSIRYAIEAFGAEGVTIARGETNPEQGWHFPDFGIAIPSAVINFTYRVAPGDEFGYSLARI
ncbi:MAG: alginate lyase family protein [Acidobacteriota bacterium]|nr:MAG: alginate lyase family protein [Acidobacteriota bacterium]